MSNDGASMPSRPAIVHASEGDMKSGLQLPAMTMPMSLAWSPARWSAISEASPPVSACVYSDASAACVKSRFSVSLM